MTIVTLRGIFPCNARHAKPISEPPNENKCAAATTTDITVAPRHSPPSAGDQPSTFDDEMARSPSLESLTSSASPKLECIKAVHVPIPSFAAPTAILQRTDLAFDDPGTFHLFPFLPAEIRHKIWKANLHAQVLHIIYDVSCETDWRSTYMHGHQHRAAWRFTISSINNVPNRAICQESRAEAARAGYELITLSDDPTKGRWFNHEFDTLFLDTNASVNYPYDDVDYDQEVDSVLPPVGEPLFQGGMKNIRYLAVSDSLWTDWPFSEDNGTDASCEYCPSFHWDYTKDEFKDMIAEMHVLKCLQIVRTIILIISDDGMVSVEFKKRGSEDQYGICLLRRLIEWKEEKGLNIEVEVV